MSASRFAPTTRALERILDVRPRVIEGGARVAVVGAGRSGRAAFELCRSRGNDVRLLDDRPLGRDVGALSSNALSEAELVVSSPGVPRTHPALADSLASGRLVGEVEVASWFVGAPMVGVTGTNGKSTTTALIAHGLSEAGYRVFAGGNLGRPLSELAQRADAVDFAVIELSSYQLESIVTAELLGSVWLNLQSDHLDRYVSEDDYALAKRRIVEMTRPDGFVVLNAHDEYCRRAAALAPRVAWFGRRPVHLEPRIAIDASGFGERSNGERYELSSPVLLGRHNLENAAAAVEVFRSFDVSPDVVRGALGSFAGLSHRLEYIPTSDWRRWYNDSKATNVAATQVALEAVDGSKVLILGGRAKNERREQLVERARSSGVVRVLAIGESARDWCHAFESTIRCDVVETLERAVAEARTTDAAVVLFSPACASFDQFTSFEHRGDVFRKLVREGVS